MLSMIPRSRPINIINNLPQEDDPASRQELRILDAFAHLAVGKHDVAALATDCTFGSETRLHIISCVNHTSFDQSVSSSTLTGSQ